MISRTSQIRPPVKYPGAKYYLVPKIVPLIEPHDTYCESYGGMANVLLNKPRSPVEVYNDLNSRLTRFWTVLRDHGDELRQKLQLTPYSANEFVDCADEDHPDVVEMVRRDFVRWRQSFGGTGKSFSETIHRVRGKTNDPERIGYADVVSAWLSAIDSELPKVSARFRGVQIVNHGACDVILKWDSPKTLHYMDPPYPSDTRTTKDLYECEETLEGHKRLAGMLPHLQGKVILSTYDHPIYTDALKSWRRIEIDMPNNAAGGLEKRRMTELLYLNY